MPQQHRLKLPSASRDEQISGRDMWNRNRSESGAHFYTLGYTGRKLEELIARMLGAGYEHYSTFARIRSACTGRN